MPLADRLPAAQGMQVKFRLTLRGDEMRKVASIISAVFFLTIFCTIALGQVVPGAVLHLDARDNPAHPAHRIRILI